MANNCFVDFYISTHTNTEAAKLIEILYKNISEANKRDEGAFIGSKTRHIFDAGVYSHTSIVVKLEGWVKWSIDYTEIKDIIDWLMQYVSVVKLSMRYEELGNMMYGEYVYRYNAPTGKKLYDKYVDEKDFPDDNGEDTFYERLEQIFRKKAVKKYIPFH